MNVRRTCIRLNALLRGGATLDMRHYQGLKDVLKSNPAILNEEWFSEFMSIHRDNLIRCNKEQHMPKGLFCVDCLRRVAEAEFDEHDGKCWMCAAKEWIKKHNELHEEYQKEPEFDDLDAACEALEAVSEAYARVHRNEGVLIDKVAKLVEERDRWRKKYRLLKQHADHFARRVG